MWFIWNFINKNNSPSMFTSMAFSLRMQNTWIETKFHLTPLSQGSSLTIKWKEWSSNRGVIHWWHLSHHNVQCLYCILRYFAILFSTQKVVKFQKTYCCSKLNFNLVGKIRIGSKIFKNYYPSGMNICYLQLQKMHFQ